MAVITFRKNIIRQKNAADCYIGNTEIPNIVLNGTDAVFRDLNLNEVGFDSISDRFDRMLDVFEIDSNEKAKRVSAIRNACVCAIE